MSKMGQIHDMAMNEKEEDLEDYLQLLGWRLGASRDGAKYFIEAAKEIKENKKKPKFLNIEESDSSKL
tara:strand:+ start:640 stop:843 length:204 start_codon:yes stop_codon:yes gene_type:complete